MTGKNEASSTMGPDGQRTLQLANGHRLGYAQYGETGKPVVFYFHGLPGSRLEPQMLTASATALGVHLIAVDRPGYGLSGFQPGRRLVDRAHDLAELADRLMIETFGLLGVSGGGPYALACARQFPRRVRFTGVVCGLAPMENPALGQSMAWWTRLAFYLAQRHPLVLDMLYGRPVSWLVARRPSLLIRLLARANGEPDSSALLRPEIFEALLANVLEAFRQGPKGAETDLVLLGKAWGFHLEDIQIPVQIWHGDADRMVPLQHGRYLQAKLANSTLEVVPGEAHFSLPVNHGQRILKTLAGTR